MTKKYSLILASQSPRRKEMLSWLNIPFTVVPSDIPEESSRIEPVSFALDLATQKQRAVFSKLKQHSSFDQEFFPLVEGSDTIVVLENRILGKPKDRLEAKQMLQQLSGKTHEVITAVSLGLQTFDHEYQEDSLYVKTQVDFAPIDDDFLEYYVNSDDPLDKAGAYGIQGEALCFVRGIRGSYSNVVGLPMQEFIEQFKNLIGFSLDHTGLWRKSFHM